MMPPKYKYYVKVYSEKLYDEQEDIFTEYEINPHFKELKKKYSKESQQEFFRISLDGKITLQGDDYEIIKNASVESKFTFHINKLDAQSGNFIEYFNGEFSKTDCKLNHSKKQCELKISPIDSYTNILSSYKNTYDLLKLAPGTSKIILTKRPVIQIYILGGNTISNYMSGTFWEDDVETVIDDMPTLVQKYHFAYNQAATEFYLTGASNNNVNGLYAGTNGVWVHTSNNYKITLIIVDDHPIGDPSGIFLYICALSLTDKDGNELYRRDTFLVESDCMEPGKIFIDSRVEGAELTNVNDSTDMPKLTSVFAYKIGVRLICDVDTIAGEINTYDLPVEDITANNRNYKKCIGFEMSPDQIVASSYVTDEPTQFGVNDYGQYFSNDNLKALYTFNRPMPACRQSWINTSIWVKIDVFPTSIMSAYSSANKKFTLNDSFSISEVIRVMLKQIAPELMHEPTEEYSQFLYADVNPILQEKFYVYITQKTNILKSEYDQAAQKANISFEDLMNMLKNCFRCYWFIEDNKLKIEHISYFMNGGSYNSDDKQQLNLLPLNDMFNKKSVLYFQNSVEYDKTNLASRYEFEWMDDVTDLFAGVYIDVKSNYIDKDKDETVTISNFSSDIDYMLHHPENFSNDGFALLCPIKNDNSELEIPIITNVELAENNFPYYAIVQNYYASWNYLINTYMKDMPAYKIKSNMVNTLKVEDIKKCMTQDVEFMSEEDPDVKSLIETQIGSGSIEELSINLLTRKISAKLCFKPQ